MSIEATCKTQIKDKIALTEALQEIFGQNAIEVLTEGKRVTGYLSNRKPTIVIKIPGLIGTAGYVEAKDGTWELVYDSSDARKLSKVIATKGKTGAKDPLAQIYAKHQVRRAMQKMRGRVIEDSVDQDGSIRMKIKLTSY